MNTPETPKYRHDEWCATKIGAWPFGDPTKCDCEVALLEAKDKDAELVSLRKRLEAAENMLAWSTDRLYGHMTICLGELARRAYRAPDDSGRTK